MRPRLSFRIVTVWLNKEIAKYAGRGEIMSSDDVIMTLGEILTCIGDFATNEITIPELDRYVEMQLSILFLCDKIYLSGNNESLQRVLARGLRPADFDGI